MLHKDLETPNITDAEWRVMQVLWKRKKATANEVVDDMKDNSDWKPKTIHTLLRRLLFKGVLEHIKCGREYIYQPLLSGSDCQLAESRSFLGKVFDGKVTALLAAFIESEEMSPQEIEELKDILETVKR